MISIDASASNDTGHERATARNEQWYVETRAGIMPMTASAIEESLQRGVLQASTKVWKSGMQVWQPISYIAGLAPQPDERSRQLSSRPALRVASVPKVSLHDTPLPALSQFDWAPDSVTPAPAPVHTLIRPIAYERRGQRTQPQAPQPSRQPASARGTSWLQQRRTWHNVLFSAIVGSALGLAVYYPLLWHPSTERVSPLVEPATERAAAPLAAALPRAALPRAALPLAAVQAPPQAVLPTARADNAGRATSALAPSVSEVPAPQAKRSPAKRSKRAAARRKPQRPRHTDLPAWP